MSSDKKRLAGIEDWKGCEPANMDDGRYHGAMGGMFWPGQDAVRILGEDRWDYGHAFAYLFRRFGYSEYGWDGYKSLARYCLTTPMDGVVLVVNPGTKVWISFGYSLRSDVEAKCRGEEMRPNRIWAGKFRRWAAKNYRVLPVDADFWSPKKLCDRLFRAYCVQSGLLEEWWDKDPANVAFSTEFGMEWIARKSEENSEFKRRYRGVEPWCPRLDLSKWMELDDGMVSYRVGLALSMAIADLMAPVNVRDWFINVLGEVDDPDAALVPDVLRPEDDGHKVAAFSAYSKMAGYGFRYAAENVW